MESSRQVLLAMIADPAISRPRLLGAILSDMRVNGSDVERRLSDACDKAFRDEHAKIVAEQKSTTAVMANDGR